MTRYAVITLAMLAIGRAAFADLAHSTCPVVASARIPAFALTLRGAPATAMCGPGARPDLAGTVVACPTMAGAGLVEAGPGGFAVEAGLAEAGLAEAGLAE